MMKKVNVEFIRKINQKYRQLDRYKIYILSPEPPNKLKERLCAGCKKETVNIWYGISGYSQKVEEILRNLNNESTTIREHFYNNLFGKSEIEILRVNSVNGDI